MSKAKVKHRTSSKHRLSGITGVSLVAALALQQANASKASLESPEPGDFDAHPPSTQPIDALVELTSISTSPSPSPAPTQSIKISQDDISKMLQASALVDPIEILDGASPQQWAALAPAAIAGAPAAADAAAATVEASSGAAAEAAGGAATTVGATSASTGFWIATGLVATATVAAVASHSSTSAGTTINEFWLISANGAPGQVDDLADYINNVDQYMQSKNLTVETYVYSYLLKKGDAPNLTQLDNAKTDLEKNHINLEFLYQLDIDTADSENFLQSDHWVNESTDIVNSIGRGQKIMIEIEGSIFDTATPPSTKDFIKAYKDESGGEVYHNGFLLDPVSFGFDAQVYQVYNLEWGTTKWVDIASKLEKTYNPTQEDVFSFSMEHSGPPERVNTGTLPDAINDFDQVMVGGPLNFGIWSTDDSPWF